MSRFDHKKNIHIYIYIYIYIYINIRCIHGIFGRESPNIWSYTEYIYGSGQPYKWGKGARMQGACSFKHCIFVTSDKWHNARYDLSTTILEGPREQPDSQCQRTVLSITLLWQNACNCYHKTISIIFRVGMNCIYTPYMIVCMVISLPKIPYIYRIYQGTSGNMKHLRFSLNIYLCGTPSAGIPQSEEMCG